MVQECVKCLKQKIKIDGFKGIKIQYKEYVSKIVPRYIAIGTLGVRSQNNWEIRPLYIEE